jgi:hypothetical protein
MVLIIVEFGFRRLRGHRGIVGPGAEPLEFAVVDEFARRG